MGTGKTYIGLAFLLGGVFGSVGIFAFIIIRKSMAIQSKYDEPKTTRPPMQSYEKLAIFSLIGLLAFVIISGLVVLLIFI